MSEEIIEAQRIADEIENGIIKMDLSEKINYSDVLKLSEYTIEKVIKEIPRYTGNLNPKWKKYDLVREILKGRRAVSN
jgi:hypothetical protein